MVLGRRDNRGGEEGNMCWGCGREGYVDVDICSGGSKEISFSTLCHSILYSVSSACGPKSSSSSSPLLLCSALSVVATFQQQLVLPSAFLVNQLLIILVIVTSSVHG